MDSSEIGSIVRRHAYGAIPLAEAAERIDKLLAGTMFGNGADSKVGPAVLPAVVFAEKKNPDEIAEEFENLLAHSPNILIVKTTALVFGRIRNIYTDAEWHESSRLIRVLRDQDERGAGEIGVVAVAADDIPIAEEAALTAEAMGNSVKRVWNGHTNPRRELSSLRDCRAIVVAAENAYVASSLTSKLTGAMNIVVPTGDGQTASPFDTTELSGSSNPMVVVEKHDGFGAGLVASLINRKRG